MKPVKNAVFPIAGMGTRFLPTTKAVPKEILPVVDEPVIRYAVEEACEAGIEQFVFITGRGKHVIANHFDHAYELETLLSRSDKATELNSLLESLPPTGSRVDPPAAAVGPGPCGMVRSAFVGNEPFAILLPNDLMVGKRDALSQVITSYNQVAGGIIVAAEEKVEDEIKRYGVVKPGATKGNATEVLGLVEKPASGTEPSNLCVIGRYILQLEIFAVLDKQERGAGNEIQLTDAMAQLIGKTTFHAVKTDCARYDCGDKIGFLHANIAASLSRPDIASILRQALTRAA